MEIFGQLAAVGAVLGVLYGGWWWLKRRGLALPLGRKRSQGRKLECLERLPLGPQHTLHLVRLGETALLVASSPAGCTLVDRVPRGEAGIAPSSEACR
jgi:flagellar biogenesis protein FliO